MSAFDDFAWIQTADKNCFVVASATDFQLAVVDIVKKEVVRTITGLEANKLVSVRNNQYDNVADQINEQFDENGVWASRIPERAPAAPAQSSSSVSGANAATMSADDSSSDTLAIAALAISCIAIVAVMTNFALGKGTASSNDTIAGQRSQAPPSVN